MDVPQVEPRWLSVLQLRKYLFILSFSFSLHPLFHSPHHCRHTLIHTQTRAQTLQLQQSNTLRPGF